MKIKIAMIVLALLTYSVSAFAGDFRVVGTEEMKKLVEGKKKVVIVDARTPEEFAQGRIPKAINVPYESFSVIDKFLPRDKNVPVIFYCRGYA